MKHGRQERTGADQITGGNEDAVRMAIAQASHHARHRLRPAGRDDELFHVVGGIGNPDAGRGTQITVKVVDRENAQMDRVCAPGEGERGIEQG
jgi:hypothetical protein